METRFCLIIISSPVLCNSSIFASNGGFLLTCEPLRYVTYVTYLDCCRVKKGGPNPVSNPVLAALLEKFKELDVPKDILERNIKRASEKGQEAFLEKTYEVAITFFYFF